MNSMTVSILQQRCAAPDAPSHERCVHHLCRRGIFGLRGRSSTATARSSLDDERQNSGSVDGLSSPFSSFFGRLGPATSCRTGADGGGIRTSGTFLRVGPPSPQPHSAGSVLCPHPPASAERPQPAGSMPAPGAVPSPRPTAAAEKLESASMPAGLEPDDADIEQGITYEGGVGHRTADVEAGAAKTEVTADGHWPGDRASTAAAACAPLHMH